MTHRTICKRAAMTLPFLAVASTADMATEGEPAVPAKIVLAAWLRACGRSNPCDMLVH